MNTARTTIRKALSAAASPAVLCSFGKDSMLVLALVREVNPSVPVLWYRNGTDESFARRIIREWNLTAFSPAPIDSYLLTNGSDRTLVHEYSWGEHRLPVLTDLAPGDRCALNAFPHRTGPLFWPFDVVLTGYRDTDEHWVKGDAPLFQEDTRMGKARLITPIRHMTSEQVLAAIYDLAIPYQAVDDELPLCTACMTGGPNEVYCPELKKFIPTHQWEADKSLTAFKQRFGLQEAAR